MLDGFFLRSGKPLGSVVTGLSLGWIAALRQISAVLVNCRAWASYTTLFLPPEICTCLPLPTPPSPGSWHASFILQLGRCQEKIPSGFPRGITYPSKTPSQPSTYPCLAFTALL